MPSRCSAKARVVAGFCFPSKNDLCLARGMRNVDDASTILAVGPRIDDCGQVGGNPSTGEYIMITPEQEKSVVNGTLRIYLVLLGIGIVWYCFFRTGPDTTKMTTNQYMIYDNQRQSQFDYAR
jgi:hypothetical protein